MERILQVRKIEYAVLSKELLSKKKCRSLEKYSNGRHIVVKGCQITTFL